PPARDPLPVLRQGRGRVWRRDRRAPRAGGRARHGAARGARAATPDARHGGGVERRPGARSRAVGLAGAACRAATRRLAVAAPRRARGCRRRRAVSGWGRRDGRGGGPGGGGCGVAERGGGAAAGRGGGGGGGGGGERWRSWRSRCWHAR